MKFHSLKALLVSLLFVTGCATMPEGIQQAQMAMHQNILAEPPGNYFIGRRYFKPDYKIWGYVRRPGQPWTTAQLVMLSVGVSLVAGKSIGVVGASWLAVRLGWCRLAPGVSWSTVCLVATQGY